jgi:hypothetical protein
MPFPEMWCASQSSQQQSSPHTNPTGHVSHVQHSIELLDPTLTPTPPQLRTTQSSTQHRSRQVMPLPAWLRTAQSSQQQSVPQKIAPPDPPVTVQHSTQQLDPQLIAAPKQSRTSQSSTTHFAPHWIIATEGASLPTTMQSRTDDESPHRIPPPALLMHVHDSMQLLGPQRIIDPVQNRTSQSHTSLPCPQRQTAPAPKIGSSGQTHWWNEQSLTKQEPAVARSQQHPCQPRNAQS